MCTLQAAIFVAEEVGTRLGEREILLEEVCGGGEAGGAHIDDNGGLLAQAIHLALGEHGGSKWGQFHLTRRKTILTPRTTPLVSTGCGVKFSPDRAEEAQFSNKS